MNTIFMLWLIASAISMSFLAYWAYGNWKQTSPNLLGKSRVHHIKSNYVIKDKV